MTSKLERRAAARRRVELRIASLRDEAARLERAINTEPIAAMFPASAALAKAAERVRQP